MTVFTIDKKQRWQRKSRYKGYRPLQRRLIHLLSLALIIVVLSACAPGEAPPTGVCDTYNRSRIARALSMA